jgi:hypothetical protein
MSIGAFIVGPDALLGGESCFIGIVYNFLSFSIFLVKNLRKLF